MTTLLVHAVTLPGRPGWTELRMGQPLAALAARGDVEYRIEEPSSFVPDHRPIDKILLVQRFMLTLAGARRLVQALLEAGYVAVMEIDDYPGRSGGYAQGDFIGFRAMHALQTTTEPLAAILRQHNPTIGVFANQIAELPPLAERTGPPVIFFGALHREGDWAPVMPALNRLLAKHPEVKVDVMHDGTFFDALATKNKSFAPFSPYADYLSRLGGADISLMPLADTSFNSCKSDAKFIEAAAAGAVALASPTVYSTTLRHGETGLIFHNPDEFEALLEDLIEQPALRWRLASAAHDYVRKQRMLADHAGRQVQWYRWLCANRARLTAELATRAPELL